jgi:molybdopterin-guanine dinucleotide biosynthesis protein
MAIVVIGGHSRSVGKTSVVAGLISALREYDWTAVKITQYGHGVCSTNGAPCDCATADHTWAISEERDRNGETDTARFLVAGAARALWVRTEQGKLAEAMPALRKRIESSLYVMAESNSVLKFLRPDLYLTVLDPGTEDFKNSAREFLDRASAVILHEHSKTGSEWQGVSLKPVAGRPVFRIAPPRYVTPEIVEFVRRFLAPAEETDSLRPAQGKLSQTRSE